MTTEAILHDTLKYINRQTKNHAYINIIDTLWKDFPIEDQELLRRQLLDRDLISVNATNHLNATNQWEFQLTTKGILLIEQGEEKLKKDFLEFLIKESDVKSFMVNNFIKPDPKASSTTNETDSGVIFLKSLKRNGLIDYDDKALAHVNTWFIDNGNNPQIKRWFDTLHEPLYVNIVVQTDSIADYQNIEKSAETFGPKKNNNKEIIPGLLSDIESGDDLLDIMKDVSAFSRVIAAKSFEPPLAIALFGRWGSGKSFFMQKLRENITSLSLRPTDTYCKGVVHIHFNAWSYMDSNLWASIVSRIFEELNNYISENTISSEVKQEVEKQLTSKLSITREEIDILETKKLSIERQIESFNQRKETLSKSLNKNIDKIQKKTIGKIIEEVETEFKAKEKIEAALKENVEYIQSENELKEILPEKYWDNPSAAYSHIKSKSAFLKEFFKKNNFSNNLVWTIVLLVIILLAPVLISNISQKLVDANFTIPQIGISFLISVGAIWKRVEIIYDKIQPIAASVWKIKDEHDKEVRDAIAKFEQEEKALKLKIENDRAEIN